MAKTALEGNKALVRAFSRAENEQDYDALEEVVAEDVVRHSVASPEV